MGCPKLLSKASWQIQKTMHFSPGIAHNDWFYVNNNDLLFLYDSCFVCIGIMCYRWLLHYGKTFKSQVLYIKKKIDNFEHFSPCFKIKIKFSFLINDDSFSDLVFLCSLVNTCCGYLIGLWSLDKLLLIAGVIFVSWSRLKS